MLPCRVYFIRTGTAKKSISVTITDTGWVIGARSRTRCCHAPKISSVWHVAGQVEILIAEGVNGSSVGLKLCRHTPQFSNTNEVLTSQDAARQQSEDDQNDA